MAAKNTMANAVNHNRKFLCGGFGAWGNDVFKSFIEDKPILITLPSNVSRISTTFQSLTPTTDEPHNVGANNPSTNTATKIAWIIAAILFAWLLLFPLVGGLVVANDDLKFLRGELNVGSLADNIRFGWLHTNSFRPLENIVAYFCNQQTLACWPVVPVQLGGLAFVAVGVVALVRRVLPSMPIAAPLILIWIFLSPSTMTSLWQMDTCSQTWTAAVGLWCGILCWDIFMAARAGASSWPKILALFVLAAIGMNIKETFFGWSASVGTGLIVAIIVGWKHNHRASLRAAVALFPIALMPLIYLLIRYKFGGLAGVQSLEENPEARYQVGLGENLVTNIITSAFGLFANGPLHLFNNDAAMLPLRALPVLSGLAAGAMILAAAALRVLHKKTPCNFSLRVVLLAAAVCMFSIVVTLPMGAVSDLYGFGPNIGSGLVVVTAALMLWNSIDENDRFIARGIGLCATLVLAAVGLYGVASRTYQFSMTWYYTRELNRIVMTHQASLPQQKPGEVVAYIYFPPSCYTGHIYGQIMIRPLQSLSIQWMQTWLNKADPKHPLQIVLQQQSFMRPGLDLVVDCKQFPVRKDW